MSIMEMDMYQDWLKLNPKFNGTKEVLICPNCGANTIRYQFVGDSEHMIGHLYLWCDKCLHGIHVSRVNIPKDVEILPYGVPVEILKNKIPKYKFVE